MAPSTGSPDSPRIAYVISMHQVGRMSGISRNTVRPSSETFTAEIRDGFSSMWSEP